MSKMPRRGASGIAASHRLASLAEHVCANTHFSSEERKALLQFHQKLIRDGPLDRPRFREILSTVFSIFDDVMLDLVLRAFDSDNDGYVDDREWVRGLSIMLRGTLDELIEYTYFVYDVNGDKSLAREELYLCLRGCLSPGFGIEDDEIDNCEQDIVEIAMAKLDADHDGQITFEDFRNAVQTDPLILQACGSCVPSSGRCAAFLSLASDRYYYYSRIFPGLTHKKHPHHHHSRSHSHSNSVTIKNLKALSAMSSGSKKGGSFGIDGKPRSRVQSLKSLSAQDGQAIRNRSLSYSGAPFSVVPMHDSQPF